MAHDLKRRAAPVWPSTDFMQEPSGTSLGGRFRRCRCRCARKRPLPLAAPHSRLVHSVRSRQTTNSAETDLGGRKRHPVSLSHDCSPSQTAKLAPHTGPCRGVKPTRPLSSFTLPSACVLFSVPDIPAPDRSGSSLGCWYPTRVAMPRDLILSFGSASLCVV